MEGLSLGRTEMKYGQLENIQMNLNLHILLKMNRAQGDGQNQNKKIQQEEHRGTMLVKDI